MKELVLIYPAEQGHSVTKTINNQGEKISDYDLGEYVEFKIIEYENFHEALDKILSSRNYLLILAGLTEIGKHNHKAGIASVRKKDVTLQDRSGTEFVLDIDGHEIENWNPLDPEPGIKSWMVQNSLDCDVTWQITSSQKLNTNKARLRLYLELDSPEPLELRKALAKALGGDGSVYTVTQPIYTAPPLIEDDLPDFIPVRHGFIRFSTRTLKIEIPKEIIKEQEFSYDSAIDSIKSTKNYHESLRGLALRLVNKGLRNEEIMIMLKGSLNEVPAELRDERWHSRCDDKHLSDLITSARSKVLNENVTIQDSNQLFTNPLSKEIDFPEGDFGVLCQECYEMQHHQNKTVAVTAAFALIAGIVGRKYNINGAGCNLYISVLLDTGQGKKSISDIIDKALMSDESNIVAASYKGKQSFTGPKALFDMLSKTGMSKVCVITEAGLLYQTTSGNQAGLTRAILDLYTKSGSCDLAGDEGYSNTENNIERLRAPALTIIQESTPDSFIQAMTERNSERSGELARMWMLRHVGEKKFLNRNRRLDFSPSTKKKLAELMKFCFDEQCLTKDLKTEIPKVISIKHGDWLYDYSDKYTALENEHKRNGNALQQVMCTRAFVKAMKIMSIVSIYNSHDPKHIEITEEVRDWVDENVIKLEIDTITDLFTRDSTNDMLAFVKQNVIPVIIKILNGKYENEVVTPKKELREKGIFTHTNISQVLKNFSSVKKLTSRQDAKDGINMIMEYMINAGLLTLVSKEEMQLYGSRSGKAYKITDDLERMIKWGLS